MSKKVTIQDIADALGVSRNTVSKAINNTEGLADATRERILQKATEMGYKQFSYVSALKKTASSTESELTQPAYKGEIALFTSTFLTNSHFASLMLDKFQREIAQMGYTLNTHRVTKEDLANFSLPITFYPERTSAVICIEMFNWEYDQMVCGLGIPVLFVDGPAKLGGRSLPADQLYMNNTDELIRFVNDMLEQGQTRIGFAGNFDYCQSFFERYLAFRTAMLLAGVPVEEQYCIHYTQVSQIKEQLARLDRLPDVFICTNDFDALDLMRALAELGKQVPRDVRICGFDDSHESRASNPPMTTIHIHTQIMAYSAVQLLMSRIQEPSLDFRIVHTETELIYRESTKLD